MEQNKKIEKEDQGAFSIKKQIIYIVVFVALIALTFYAIISQNENLTEFIPFTFKHVKRLRNNNVQGIKAEEEFKIIKYYKDEILEYKPNIIIFCITYNNISELHKLFEE